jgi:hypothetical protein
LGCLVGPKKKKGGQQKKKEKNRKSPYPSLFFMGYPICLLSFFFEPFYFLLLRPDSNAPITVAT